MLPLSCSPGAGGPRHRGGVIEGHSHALSGACTGLAAGLLLHLRLPADAALAGFTAGTSLLPDLDSCGSSAARCLGFASRALAWVVSKLSRGHRHLTHSILGLGIMTGLAWLACHYRHDWGGLAGLVVLVGLSVSAGLEALHVTDGHLADVIGLAAAIGVVVYGYGLTLIPLATAIGLATHVAGDMLTDSGSGCSTRSRRSSSTCCPSRWRSPPAPGRRPGSSTRPCTACSPCWCCGRSTRPSATTCTST